METGFKVKSVKLAKVLIDTPICKKCGKGLHKYIGDTENPRLKCLNPFCNKFDIIVGRAYGEWIDLGSPLGEIEIQN